MRKRMVAIAILTAISMLAMTGCGSKKEETRSMPDPEPVVEATTEGAVEEATEEAVEEEILDEELEVAELEYWAEDSAAAASIKAYVEAVTDPESDQYIPEEDRVAVFDLDGTIIGELYPSYFEYMMFIHRALYDETYEAPEPMKEFATALEEGIATGTMPAGNEILHAKYAGLAYAGMTLDEFHDYVKEFMNSEAEGFTNLTRGEAFYKPMVSLVHYLSDNYFQVYIVTGSDRYLARALIEDTLDIPMNHVIGMSYQVVASGQGLVDGLDYVFTSEDDLVRTSNLLLKTLKMNKVSIIMEEIGITPVLAFGNSSGDLSMARFAADNKQYQGKAYLVLCDDLVREYGNLDKAGSLAATCEEQGYETISMANDFATIYGEDVTLAAAEEEAVEEAPAEIEQAEGATEEVEAETEAIEEVTEEVEAATEVAAEAETVEETVEETTQEPVEELEEAA